MTLKWVSTYPADADTIAYMQAVETADGQALELDVIKAYDAFILGCKHDGIWDAIKASCILAGARTLDGALVPLKGGAPTNNNFVSGDYNRKTGLVGDGSTKYLDSNRNNNADPQDSFHFSAYASSASQSGFNNIIGSRLPGDNSTARAIHLSSGPSAVGYANFSGALSVNQTYSSGFIGVNRSSATLASLRVNSSITSSSATSTSPSGNSLLIPVFARRTGVSSLDGYSDARLAFYSIGESLDLALLDNRISTFMTTLDTVLP